MLASKEDKVRRADVVSLAWSVQWVATEAFPDDVASTHTKLCCCSWQVLRLLCKAARTRMLRSCWMCSIQEPMAMSSSLNSVWLCGFNAAPAAIS